MRALGGRDERPALGRYRYGERVTEPERTCIGCRVRGGASSMVRVVAAAPGVVVDVRHRLPGRGAWVHPQLACIETATRRKAWSRALKVPGLLVDPVQVFQHVAAETPVF